jgi:N-acetylglucosamine kinase-like BadF-type ATPase
MEKIFLSVDGGGSNLRGIVFDENLKLKDSVYLESGVNINFDDRLNIERGVDRFLLAVKDKIHHEIDTVFASIVGPFDIFESSLKKTFHDIRETKIIRIQESFSHIYASSLGEYGGVALSGTGSGALYFGRGGHLHHGGFGIPIGDEGSGAWIGMQGISAIIRARDGWGEITSLTDALYEKFKMKRTDSLFELFYGDKKLNQRSLFAGFSREVSKCADGGDSVSRNIVAAAGTVMGEQMIAILGFAKRENLIGGDSPTVYASGGAWKGSALMFKTFCDTVNGVYPEIPCERAIFDPVMGGIIRYILDQGEDPIAMKDKLIGEFNEFYVRRHYCENKFSQ